MISTLITFYYLPLLVSLGSCIIGFLAGYIGTFAVINRFSLLGDALAHAALPGIACMFLITSGTRIELLLLGGCISSSCALLLLYIFSRTTTISFDALLGTLLSVFFGAGLVLITHIQKTDYAQQAFMQRFIFGNAALVAPEDIIRSCLIGALLIGIILLMHKNFVLISFDKGFAQNYKKLSHYSAIGMYLILLFIIIMGLQTMGALLMSTLLIAPTLAVKPWVSSVSTLTRASGVLAAIAALIGTLVSTCNDRIPTGPSIVIIITSFTLISLLAEYMWKKYARS